MPPSSSSSSHSGSSQSQTISIRLREAWMRSNSTAALQENINAVLKTAQGPLSESDRDVVDSYLNAITRALGMDLYMHLQSGQDHVQHCVRCHASFSVISDDKALNTPCIIPHSMNSRVSDPGPNNSERYRSTCCGSLATVEETKLGSGRFVGLELLTNCYEGQHTTDPNVVQKCGQGRVGYNYRNIHPCDIVEGRCVRGCVLGRKSKLVWDWEFESRYATMSSNSGYNISKRGP